MWLTQDLWYVECKFEEEEKKQEKIVYTDKLS